MKSSSVLLIVAKIILSSITIPNKQILASIADHNVHVSNHDSICETPACVHSASLILENMDSSIDPCENFYQFACGKFVKESIIPDSRGGVGTLKILDDKVKEQLRLRIEDEIEEDDEYIIKTKSYYQMCMNTEKIEINSEKELQTILKNLGSCPVLDLSWDELNFDWRRTVYKAGKMGYSTNMFVTVQVIVDPDNSTRNIVDIDQAETEISREYLINGTDSHIAKVNLKFMTDVFELLGAERMKAKKAANEIIDFEMQLQKISLPKEELRDGFKLNNRMTLHQLETNYKGIPWTEYLNEVLAPYAHLHRNEEVIVADTHFLENIPQLLAKTPKHVLSNYLVFNIISQSIDYMGKNFLNLQFEVLKAVNGIQEQLPRWKKCLEHVSEHFAVALGELFVRYYFGDSAKTDASYLAQNLRNSLRHLLRKADWMDETTKVAALEKLQTMVAYVGYGNELKNEDMINTFYQDIELDFGSFFISEINLKKFKKKVNYSHLRKPANALEWIDRCSASDVNAAYYNSNNFVLSAGFLQGRLYNKNRPNYMNYGAIGSVIGHEMSHAFDDEGSQYDKNGNLFNWWKNETREVYVQRTKCIIEQESNFVKKKFNVTINGINTQGENIADNVGLKAAYFAYNEWAKKHGKEFRLPGLYYTPHQMFWISYANTLCEKVRPEYLQSSIVDDPHSSSEFRVIGPVSNSHQFSNDFECPLGSPMNPVKKCSIW